MGYNSLLERQIRRHLRGDTHIPDSFKKLLQAISDSYDFSITDREMLERVLVVSSEELNKANAKIRRSLEEIRQQNAMLESQNKIIQGRVQEKETLLREIHHRVKNNMQIITSLMALQARQEEDAGLTALFKNTENRVHSMAMIHEMLYEADDLAQIDYDWYLKELVYRLIRSIKGQGSRVDSVVDAQAIRLGIDIAVPLGLLINELVTNSLKYAFPDGRSGAISISIKKKASTYLVKVGDDGVGIPLDIRPKNSSSLGLKLVGNLVDQLDGTIKREKKKGANYLITFQHQDANSGEGT